MTTALSTPFTTAVADLLLVRLALPNATPKQVCSDLGKLLGTDLTSGELDDLRNELTLAGFLTKGRRNTFALSPAGRERALRFLGVAELPPRLNWSAVISRYLFPQAAALSADASAKLRSGDQLAAYVLKQKYGLGTGAGSTVKQVVEAVACQALGFPNETNLTGLLCAVLSKHLATERLAKEQLVKQLPLFETGLTACTADAIRRKVVRDWLSATPSPAPPPAAAPEPFDLPVFAATVRALAASSPPQDRFHDNKVFIAALWRASQREPSLHHISLSEFKQRLVEANVQHLLHLSRADLVQAMDSQLVAESETVHQNATFHFVLLEGNHP